MRVKWPTYPFLPPQFNPRLQNQLPARHQILVPLSLQWKGIPAGAQPQASAAQARPGRPTRLSSRSCLSGVSEETGERHRPDEPAARLSFNAITLPTVAIAAGRAGPGQQATPCGPLQLPSSTRWGGMKIGEPRAKRLPWQRHGGRAAATRRHPQVEMRRDGKAGWRGARLPAASPVGQEGRWSGELSPTGGREGRIRRRGSPTAIPRKGGREAGSAADARRSFGGEGAQESAGALLPPRRLSERGTAGCYGDRRQGRKSTSAQMYIGWNWKVSSPDRRRGGWL